MTRQILIGSLLMIVTTLVHSGCTLGALWALRRSHAERWGLRSRWTRVSLVTGLVLVMFLASLVEVTVWAATYLAEGAIADVETAVYFSMVTFTTLGYGEVVLGENWRLLASLEAATGIITFGWTTALIFAFVQRVAAREREAAEARDR